MSGESSESLNGWETIKSEIKMYWKGVTICLFIVFAAMGLFIILMQQFYPPQPLAWCPTDKPGLMIRRSHEYKVLTRIEDAQNGWDEIQLLSPSTWSTISKSTHQPCFILKRAGEQRLVRVSADSEYYDYITLVHGSDRYTYELK